MILLYMHISESRIQDGRASPVVVERAETTQNLEMVEIMRRLTEQSLWYQQAMLGKIWIIHIHMVPMVHRY